MSPLLVLSMTRQRERAKRPGGQRAEVGQKVRGEGIGQFEEDSQDHQRRRDEDERINDRQKREVPAYPKGIVVARPEVEKRPHGSPGLKNAPGLRGATQGFGDSTQMNPPKPKADRRHAVDWLKHPR